MDNRKEVIKKKIEEMLIVRPFGVSEKKHQENLKKLMDEYTYLKNQSLKQSKAKGV